MPGLVYTGVLYFFLSLGWYHHRYIICTFYNVSFSWKGGYNVPFKNVLRCIKVPHISTIIFKGTTCSIWKRYILKAPPVVLRLLHSDVV